ncbi:MAG: hypothetical protein ABIZ04_13950 [Opitutus sp.]
MNLLTPSLASERRRGFCIYIDTFFQGPTLAVREGEGWPCVFETEIDAQREIVDALMIRLTQFMQGQREFDDAITVEEYVVPVEVLPDGSIIDEAKRHFGKE